MAGVLGAVAESGDAAPGLDGSELVVRSAVAGGVAGAAAPLIADAAADGAIGLWGLVLFAIVFTWQPPRTRGRSRSTAATSTQRRASRCCRR